MIFNYHFFLWRVIQKIIFKVELVEVKEELKEEEEIVLNVVMKVTCLENVPINKMIDQDPKVALTVTKKVIWLANVHNLKRKEVKDDHLLNALSVTKLVICLENVQIKTMTKIGVQISVKD